MYVTMHIESHSLRLQWPTYFLDLAEAAIFPSAAWHHQALQIKTKYFKQYNTQAK
jgi:hypothetical protein